MDKLNTYLVTIEETLSKDIKVQAKSYDEALWEARGLYDQEKVVLTTDDFMDVEFHVIRVKSE